ncbi:MAG: porphyrinogen peroxidase [Actinomycetota bacterium]|jgi:putative iron-dependent peroxidase|nr:porphyrinogen peroxidase [Actinomycetota bacterium]
MPVAQPGIFAQGTRSHRHLEFDSNDGVAPEALLEALRGLRQPSVTAGGANIVVGFRASLWEELDPNARGVGDFTFPVLDGVANTPHDVWVWTHGTGEDVMLDVARAVAALLAPVAHLATDVAGFVYHDGRDLTGFIDGTENPVVEEANTAAIVPDGQPGAGGAYAITQRWVHDLAAFHALAVDDQERVFGRTKPDSVELDGTAKPANAHIARVVIEEDGEELEIYRRSVPYGQVAELGLYFVAFSADHTRFDKMLRRMFGHSGDGLHDHLTDFSRPVSGAAYFVPSVEALGDVLA